MFGVRTDNPAQEMARMGEALIREGRLEEGTATLEESRRQNPGSIVVAGLLAEAYTRGDRFEEALVLSYRGKIIVARQASCMI